jgi:hypothetical protein
VLLRLAEVAREGGFHRKEGFYRYVASQKAALEGGSRTPKYGIAKELALRTAIECYGLPLQDMFS